MQIPDRKFIVGTHFFHYLFTREGGAVGSVGACVESLLYLDGVDEHGNKRADCNLYSKGTPTTPFYLRNPIIPIDLWHSVGGSEKEVKEEEEQSRRKRKHKLQ